MHADIRGQVNALKYLVTTAIGVSVVLLVGGPDKLRMQAWIQTTIIINIIPTCDLLMRRCASGVCQLSTREAQGYRHVNTQEARKPPSCCCERGANER
jgi:hypothetical protein